MKKNQNQKMDQLRATIREFERQGKKKVLLL